MIKRGLLSIVGHKPTTLIWQLSCRLLLSGDKTHASEHSFQHRFEICVSSVLCHSKKFSQLKINHSLINISPAPNIGSGLNIQPRVEARLKASLAHTCGYGYLDDKFRRRQLRFNTGAGRWRVFANPGIPHFIHFIK